MSQKDTPWGAEEFIINSEVKVEEDHGNLVVKKCLLEPEEMTEIERHRNANVILYVLKGAVSIKDGEDFYELEEGESHFIEPNHPHQIDNLDDSLSEVMKIIFPYNRKDVEVIENPYE